jgi:hypothetical protein
MATGAGNSKRSRRDSHPLWPRPGVAAYTPFFFPVVKAPEELRQGSFLNLDLVDQVRILYDPQNILREYLADLAARFKAMGARRVYKGSGYYWVLKPDYRWSDRVEL